VNLLQNILAHKRGEVDFKKQAAPIELLRERPGYQHAPISLAAALQRRSFAVIAEAKKASPSRGVIREVYDPAAIARAYEQCGAAAVSVLTDSRYFHGTLNDLMTVREASSLPILRKDFILDSYQLAEAKSAGADAILLIAAALAPNQLAELQEEARTLGLECLVEIHNEDELQTALESGATVIGVNNRDLTTFETDIGTSVRLAPLVTDRICVSESGISSQADIAALRGAGIRAVLVGEAFMRAANPGDELAKFLSMAEGPS
jgi:indole-3-glycerol phosphate synthase